MFSFSTKASRMTRVWLRPSSPPVCFPALTAATISSLILVALTFAFSKPFSVSDGSCPNFTGFPSDKTFTNATISGNGLPNRSLLNFPKNPPARFLSSSSRAAERVTAPPAASFSATNRSDTFLTKTS